MSNIEDSNQSKSLQSDDDKFFYATPAQYQMTNERYDKNPDVTVAKKGISLGRTQTQRILPDEDDPSPSPPALRYSSYIDVSDLVISDDDDSEGPDNDLLGPSITATSDGLNVDDDDTFDEDDSQQTERLSNLRYGELQFKKLAPAQHPSEKPQISLIDDNHRQEEDAYDDDQSESSVDEGEGDDEEYQDGDEKTTKNPSSLLSIGKSTLQSLNRKRSLSRKKKPKDNAVGGDNMDSSWRASFSRDRRKQLPISQSLDNQVLSPSSQLCREQTKEQQPSIFRYIRSWGRDKQVFETQPPDNLLPPPPSLELSRSSSGPLYLLPTLAPVRAISGPVQTSYSDVGKSTSVSPLSLHYGSRQRSNSTTNAKQSSGLSSPPTPSSPQDKQKTLKQQLLAQIRQQHKKGKMLTLQILAVGETSPQPGYSQSGDLSSDDNDSAVDGGQDDEDGNLDETNDATSYDDTTEDDESSIESSIDWNSIPPLPNRFCQAQSSSQLSDSHPFYLDTAALTHKVTRKDAHQIVKEHRVLLQAVLQLLAERDQVGVEGNMDSADNIWKKGPLRKLSTAPLMVRRMSNHKRSVAGGVWKVRYVELRHGNLTYYEDSGNDTTRKTIHLRQADTIIKDSLHIENKRGQQPPGYCFEVMEVGSPTTIWMASSEEERQAWVRAIKGAMIGEVSATNNIPSKSLDLTPYQDSLNAYEKLRESLQKAKNQEAYLTAIQAAMKEVASLQVPVEWVREQIEQDLSPLLLGTMKPPKHGMSPQKALKYSIAEFWKNMKRTTFSLNGLTVPRQSLLSSERVLGALTRSILEFDKAFLESNRSGEDDFMVSQISELQAVSYSRNILLSILRSKARQDAACAAKYLLEIRGLVILDKSPDSNTTIGSSDELVYMEVSFAGTDLSDDFLPDSEEMSGWVWTRTRRRIQTPIAVPSSSFKPKYTFAVLSGAMLSYYEASSPRPHGLRGQLALVKGATVTDEGPEQIIESSGKGDTDNNMKTRYVLCISVPGHQDRLLSIENAADVLPWKDAIQAAIDSAGSIQNPPRVVTTLTTRAALPGKILAISAEKAIMVAEAGTKQGIRAIIGAKDIGIRAIKTSKDGGIKVIRGAVGMLLPSKSDSDDGKGRRKNFGKEAKRPSMHMLLNSSISHGRREPTVQCVVQTTQTFLIRDASSTEHFSDDDGTNRSNKEEWGWMTVQAKIYQAFLMSGGKSGRISRGVALVELDFVETNVDAEDDDSTEDDLIAEDNWKSQE